MQNIRTILEKTVLFLITVFLALLVIMATWQVISRYVLNSPSQFTDEALRFTMIWLVYLGASYAFGLTDRHMSLGLIKDALKGRKRLILETFNYLAVMGFIVTVLLKGGFNLVSVGVGQHSDSLDLPMNWVYTIIPLAGFLSVFFKTLNYRDVLRDIRSEENGH
ncbi:TRAP transporter small permease [Martelella mediterranea]|uniref:TRAP transporter small permease protein n=1 Tax=Martelella mediterranea TaxID=293089 RepID=A0A4R3NUL4_9HYPH|nr:TRAP transporter small permease [Martelella mediterranea]TCT37141.1 TRAP-type C4-dicarboxylate transport system permease small subunit [Martelella mediterranea]